MAIRVLQVVSIMDRGGEETMIMNYYRNIDRSQVQFDFLVHYDARGIYEDEIEALGGKVYRAFPIRPWNYGKYRRWLTGFFREHREFGAVHAHILENCGFVLSAAYEAGIPIRAAHSHLAPPMMDYKFLFRKYGKSVLKRSHATRYFACGEDAGRYLFDDAPFTVLPNAIDTAQFAYSEEIRDQLRKEMGLEDRLVLGNVARFHPVKNQTYLVDIFQEVLKRTPKAVLLLIGVGEEQEAVKEKVRRLGLSDSVRFLNVRTDVDKLLQAIDVFVFPSKLEGLPVSVIEAQAAGLPCLLSNRVAEETAITELVQFIPLEDGPSVWADKIMAAAGNPRKDMREAMKKARYDICDNAAWLQRFYSGTADEEL